MQFFLALSAFVAVAVAAPSNIIAGPLASSALVRGPVATLAGPSGTIIADTGSVSATQVVNPVPAVAQRVVVSSPWAGHGLVGVPGVIGHSGVIAAPGLVGHNLLGHNLLGHNLLGHGLLGGQVILG